MSDTDDIWTRFEREFAGAFPGAECARLDIHLITKDGDLTVVGLVREGFVERLAEFDEDES